MLIWPKIFCEKSCEKVRNKIFVWTSWNFFSMTKYEKVWEIRNNLRETWFGEKKFSWNYFYEKSFEKFLAKEFSRKLFYFFFVKKFSQRFFRTVFETLKRKLIWRKYVFMKLFWRKKFRKISYERIFAKIFLFCFSEKTFATIFPKKILIFTNFHENFHKNFYILGKRRPILCKYLGFNLFQLIILYFF